MVGRKQRLRKLNSPSRKTCPATSPSGEYAGIFFDKTTHAFVTRSPAFDGNNDDGPSHEKGYKPHRDRECEHGIKIV